MDLEAFADIVIIKGDKKVVWEYLGEGCSGDYDENDPKDTPLLRFSCFKKGKEGWQELSDSSYCTRMPTSSPKKYLKQVAKDILKAIEKSSYKRKLEGISWICPEDFQK